jgi:gliding motility-associated-like protein
MNRKTTFLFSFSSFLFFLMLLALPSTMILFAQTITPQKLPFSAICAGGPHSTIPNQVFNEYQAQFKISGFASDVIFVVELSDPSGFFTSPTVTIPLPPLAGTPPDTETDKTLTFAVPIDLVGSDKYQLRIKPSVGAPSSSFTIFGSNSTKSFPAYFKAYNDSFYISDKNSTINFCSGGSVTLSVYQDPSDPDSSPLKYPQLKYNWYKDNVLIPSQTAYELNVNSPGVYYAELNYGPCTEINARSQDVIVTSSSGGSSSASITSSLGNPFCSGSEMTTLTTTAGNSYVWRKDGAVIAGANQQTYKTNIAGIYTCDIDFGGCSATSKIDLKTAGTIAANYKDVYIDKIVDEGETLSITEGETLNVKITTTVSIPTYQWYINNTEITGATESVLDITIAGNYKVSTSGCEMSFKVKYDSPFDVPKIPNIVTPNNDGANDTWIIPVAYDNTNTHVTILSSLGEIVFETDNYDNYNGWPQSIIEFKNFNPVFYYIITPNGQSAKKGSITLLK